MNRDPDDLLQRFAKPLTVLLGGVALASLIGSAVYGTPNRLPGVALESPLLLHLERALGISAALAVLLMFLFRAWRGDFPRELSMSGPKWSEGRAAQAMAAGLAEQLTDSDRRARSTFEQVRQLLEQLSDKQAKSVDEAAVDQALAEWDRAIDESSRKTKLAAAISRLPEREKLVVALKYYEGVGDDEIAQVLGVTSKRVRELERQALERIRQMIGPDFDGQHLGNTTS